jgi:AraC family transcriptional regulator of adaptative response/methylated-DNA-[protein]-cysteine methyltransferase
MRADGDVVFSVAAMRAISLDARMLDVWPSDDRLYAAFRRKDMALDGIAYIGVATTGVFCRPGCPARMPLRRNVCFFRSADDAARAGFRACKRCRPLAPPNVASDLVARLAEAVNAAPARRWRNRDIAALGVEPATARRHFQKRFAMTFLAWSRARRLAAARDSIDTGADVISAQLDAGFESPSGFRDAFAAKFGRPPSKARSAALLRMEWIDTPLGTMLALADEQAIHLLEFVNRRHFERQLSRYQARLNAAFLPGETAASRALRRALESYFAGAGLNFDVALAETGTPFQRRVWARLRAIPPGETLSYGALARDIGAPGAVRAVANANAMNRCAILIPCHRVIGADGGLTGYAGGLPRKQWLIDHERRHAAAALAGRQ